MGTLEIKPPKVGIILGWVTFLTHDFGCNLSLMIHPIIVGNPNELVIFSLTYGLALPGNRC
jgi:hypothetical protein